MYCSEDRHHSRNFQTQSAHLFTGGLKGHITDSSLESKPEFHVDTVGIECLLLLVAGGSTTPLEMPLRVASPTLLWGFVWHVRKAAGRGGSCFYSNTQRLRQEGYSLLEASLGYRVRLCYKTQRDAKEKPESEQGE